MRTGSPRHSQPAVASRLARLRRVTFAALPVFSSLLVWGQPDLPLLAPCFGDNMVLRQPLAKEGKRVVLWGWVPERLHVSIQPEGANRLLRPGEDRSFRSADYRLWVLRSEDIELPWPTSRPFSLTIRRHKSRPGRVLKDADDRIGKLEITNVVMGPVWVVRVVPNRGEPHLIDQLPPDFRVLRLSDGLWVGRSTNLLRRLQTPGWQVPGWDGSVLRALPGLVAHAAAHYSLSASAQRSSALGILVVEQELEGQRNPSVLGGESLLSKSLEAAKRACEGDENRIKAEKLRRKRRGTATNDLGSRAPTASVAHRPPPPDAEFFYDVDGFYW